MEIIIPAAAVIGGLVCLALSADLFVNAATVTAHHAKIPPLLIGMIIVGFGTSAPEMVISVLASSHGNGGLAIGNAFGSNIANIALILGVAALVRPLLFHSRVLRHELPVLTGVTLIAAVLLADGYLSRIDALILFALFAGLMGWSIRQGLGHRPDAYATEIDHELKVRNLPLKRALVELVAGIVLLIVSSRVIVWGAVEIAHLMGVSDLIIGLTIVAFGTSLPEMASSVAAVRKGEHDIAVGNVIGSNLFNTLAVVGLAGIVRPFNIERVVLTRDCPVMMGLTVSLFVLGFGFRGQGKINRLEAILLLLAYVIYTGILIHSQI